MQKRDAGDANSAYAPDSLTFRLFTWPVSLPQPIESAKQKRAKPESPAWIQSKYFSILQAKIFASADFFRRQKFCGPPEGRSLRNARSVNGTQKQNAFSGASARFRVQHRFSPHSFLARQKRMGRRRHPAPFRRRKTSAEAEEIGREGQNLHNLQKSTLDNDRKIRMIILSHNRSTGRRGKNRPV